MAISSGNRDCISGDAIMLALDMPNSEATGLAQATVQAPDLHTAKNNGIIELILPVMVVQIDFNSFIFTI
jgi:hypothetical protein